MTPSKPGRAETPGHHEWSFNVTCPSCGTTGNTGWEPIPCCATKERGCAGMERLRARVAVLEQALRHIDEMDCGHPGPHDEMCAVGVARAALARAEGRGP